MCGIKIAILVGLVALALVYSMPAKAAPVCQTSACVLIDDSMENLTGAVFGNSSLTNTTTQITQEGIGVLGGFDAHFEFFSTDPLVPHPGISTTLGIDILEPPLGSNVFSDTLSITLTGQAPTVSNNTNVSVDLHFGSDSLDEIPPPGVPFPMVVVIEEADMIFQGATSGLSDLRIEVLSDSEGGPSPMPEPSTLALLSAGLLGLGIAVKRRHWHLNVARPV